MGRGSLISALNALARESARRQRQAEAEHRRSVRVQIQNQRFIERARLIEEKETKQKYFEDKIGKAEDLTTGVRERIEELKQILDHTLHINDLISFASLRKKDAFPKYCLEESIKIPAPIPQKELFTRDIQPPSFIQKLIPGAQERYAKSLEKSESDFNEAIKLHEEREKERLKKIEQIKRKYEEAKATHTLEVQKHNEEIEEFESCYNNADPNAIVGYNSMVLERSDYPDGFPQEYRVAYVPESKELVIEYELPRPDVIPRTLEYRYVKSNDTIVEKYRKENEIKDIYQDVVAAISLRTCHEIFEADQGSHINVITFNGFVKTIDASIGKDIRPCLVSVRVTKERFLEIDLSRIEKKACLRNLGAQLSPRPYEVQPVKPIVEFDMVDKRFIEESDILADLESRPNLMDLNPFEFEHLICNLFKKLGLESKLTRSSKDGGVDVVAYDVRPVLGGKVVIQAKRYRNTVGVSAVRDLFGTMMNEGANKGILVTTSGYGPDAFEFSKDKPIELLDGGKLLYLLDQAGVKARIVFPTEEN